MDVKFPCKVGRSRASLVGDRRATTEETATTRPIRRVRFAGRRDVSPLLLRRLSDEQLGNRLASGEAAAFDELYRRYVHRLSAYGANLLGDAASGDDVAQSALLKAYGALRDGRVPDRVKPWLFRIAHNSAIDLVVRRRELPSAELPEGSTGSGEPAERSGELVAALASLPERQRRVYVLRELHGLRSRSSWRETGLRSSSSSATGSIVSRFSASCRGRSIETSGARSRLTCARAQLVAARSESAGAHSSFCRLPHSTGCAVSSPASRRVVLRPRRRSVQSS